MNHPEPYGLRPTSKRGPRESVSVTANADNSGSTGRTFTFGVSVDFPKGLCWRAMSTRFGVSMPLIVSSKQNEQVTMRFNPSPSDVSSFAHRHKLKHNSHAKHTHTHAFRTSSMSNYIVTSATLVLICVHMMRVVCLLTYLCVSYDALTCTYCVEFTFTSHGCAIVIKVRPIKCSGYISSSAIPLFMSSTFA